MKSRHFRQFVAFACGVMLLSVASCEKMNVSDADAVGEEVSVTVRVTSFEQVPFTLSRTRTSVGDVCSRLNFLIYQDGERIRNEPQKIEDEGFGAMQFKLAKGRYYLVVLAHSSSGNPTSTSSQKIQFTNATGYTDTFLYADSLIVDDADKELSLNLERIVAMVRFIFEDDIPQRADKIRFYYTGGSGTFNANEGGWGVVNSKQEQWYDINHETKPEKFDIYTIPHKEDEDVLKVMATTYHQEGESAEDIVSEKSIEGIPVKRNHITICKGYLFSPVYKMDISLSVDDVWDTDTIDFHF
ncbi:MAG: FimB/Mfa2 family fimbrial subunit [Prevotella sp.]|nr:FimB/Mfa2 family fimbrial subunit [Prevotella sp.]MBR1502287.1 FimB/Mfa2 family fimbrial subunit [Prevotella sp.]